jgi:prepilin-type N-terminal cleavage/methylation domain-containing protein/prepilin-type processing-associated H-X9-DG protein
MSRQSRSAFTIVELLVVISVISMLVSLLLPALAEARASSRQLSCGVNLRQMMMASNTYLADNAGWYLPIYPAINNPASTPNTVSWAEHKTTRSYLEITPNVQVYYASAPAIRLCPDAAYARTLVNADGSCNIRNAYGANYTEFMDWQYPDLYLYSGTAAAPLWVSYREPRVRTPSVKLAWADTLSPSIRLTNSGGYTVEKAPSPNDQIAYRHRSACNIVFYDGHTELLERTSVDVNYLSTAAQNKLWYAYK